MGKLVRDDGQVDTSPSTIAEMNEQGGWRRYDLPEPVRTPPRPDGQTAGSR